MYSPKFKVWCNCAAPKCVQVLYHYIQQGGVMEDVWKMTNLTDEDEDENKTRGIEGT